MAQQDRLDDGVAVHGHGQGLAHFLVFHDAALRVVAHGQGHGAVHALHGQLAVFFQRVDHGQRDLVGHVDAARLQFGGLCGGLCDEAVDQVVQLGRAAPVAGVALKREADLGLVVDELEGAGADRVGAKVGAAFFGDVLGRNNHGAVAGQFGQQHGVGVLQQKVHGVGVDHHDFFDRVVVRLLGALFALVTQQAVERELDGLGVERLAVMELDPFAQREAQLGVVVQKLPLGRQAGHQFHIGGAHDQAVKHLAAHSAPRHQEGRDRVPVARVLVDGDVQRAGGMGACGQSAGEREAGGGNEGFQLHGVHPGSEWVTSVEWLNFCF